MPISQKLNESIVLAGLALAAAGFVAGWGAKTQLGSATASPNGCSKGEIIQLSTAHDSRIADLQAQIASLEQVAVEARRCGHIG